MNALQYKSFKKVWTSYSIVF